MAEEKEEILEEEELPAEDDSASMPGCPFWMLTFGDVVSLLMTFFVLILSFSDLDPQGKLSKITFFRGGSGAGDIKVIGGNAAGGAIDISSSGAGGGSGGGPNLQDVRKSIDAKALAFSTENKKTIRYSLNEVNEFLSSSDDEEIGENINVEEGTGGGGFKLSIKEDFAFSVGTARFRPENKEHLDKLASFLADLPNDIIISATSNDYNKIAYPLYPSNMYLSVARASAVAKFLHEAWGIPMERISIKVFPENDKSGDISLVGVSVKQKVVIEVVSEFKGFIRSEMKRHES